MPVLIGFIYRFVRCKTFPVDERIARLKTLEDCEQFAKNVLERNRPDLAQKARKRALELRAEAYGAKTQVERDCLEAVYAYEELLAAKNGRKTRASDTWTMIKRHGVLRAIERTVNRRPETTHYSALLEMGLQDYVFEAVVMRHPELFWRETVQRSRRRLDRWKRAYNLSQRTASNSGQVRASDHRGRQAG